MNLVNIYYHIRKLLKLPKYSSDELKSAVLLYPEHKAEEMVERQDEIMIRNMLVAFSASLILSVFVLIFKKGDVKSFAMILVLGVVLQVVLIAKRKKDRKEKLEERQTELALMYCEITSKMSILIGAGLSPRKTWEKIIEDYRAKKKKEVGYRNYLYEEMELWLRYINQGISEDEAYARFGERVQTPEYLRLIGLIDSSKKNGRAELNKLLFLEAENAFDKRIMLARRRGEKITSKLLFPMMVLFILVISILIIPAFMSW